MKEKKARGSKVWLIVRSFCLLVSACASFLNGEEDLEPVSLMKKHIEESWKGMEKNSKQFYCDPLEKGDEKTCILYVPPKEDIELLCSQIDSDKIQLKRLPKSSSRVSTHGRLYLPYPYIVPGGRFSEMYGWDSFFIQLGLLKSGRLSLSEGTVKNLLFEIENYGKVLNANHTFFLNRSHPPFISTMVLLQYEKKRDVQLLKDALPLLEKYYNFWCLPPHLSEETGLCRYYESDSLPAPEVTSSEIDSLGKTHYERVVEYFSSYEHPHQNLSKYMNLEKKQLSKKFFIGDRSMRESGFDPSFLFGPFSMEVVSFNPVCLNSLLFKMEKDLAFICKQIGDKKGYEKWIALSERRKSLVNKYLWDEKLGVFLNYNFEEKSRSPYIFGTIFYPLWVGLATKSQAKSTLSYLSVLERAGGLMTSPYYSGCQWDAPFGWAPLQWIAVQGMKNYGYFEESSRVAKKFLLMVLKEFVQHGEIFEKYNVERSSAKILSSIVFGYQTNETGFGWTNGVVLDLLSELTEDEIKELNKTVLLGLEHNHR